MDGKPLILAKNTIYCGCVYLIILDVVFDICDKILATAF